MDQRIQQLANTVSKVASLAKMAHAGYQAVRNSGALKSGRKKTVRKVTKTAKNVLRSKRTGPRMELSAPVSRQVVARNYMHQHFDRAAPHDDYPEGGLRIVGELPNMADDSLGTIASGTATTTGAFSASTNSVNDLGLFYAISPTVLYNSTSSGVQTLFGSNTNVIATFAQYFRTFRFRRLWLRYEGEAPTSTVGSVQFSYDRDANAGVNIVAGGTSPTMVKFANSVTERFPWWTPARDVKLIEDMRTNKADRLWECTSAGAAMSTGLSNADYELMVQGVVLACTDTAQQATKQIYGRFRWVFVLDLYGFSSQAADGTLTASLRHSMPAKGEGKRNSPPDDYELVPVEQLSKPRLSGEVSLTPRVPSSSSTKGSNQLRS